MSKEPKPPDRPSQELTSIHTAREIADATVKPVRLQTKIQWAAIGSLCLALAGFLGWSLTFLTSVSAAQAQTAAKQEATAARVTELGARLEAVDAGRAADSQRIERKIDSLAEDTQKKLTSMQLTLEAINRKVSK